MAPTAPTKCHPGRGAVANPSGRFERRDVERAAIELDDGWGTIAAVRDERPETTVEWDSARSVISYNDSPDTPHDRSINPYRGCEHGCVYCFARPSHAFLGLSPGLDFETRLFAKRDAPARLREELARPSYRPRPIVFGINADAWQPVERRLRSSRELLEVLWECRHPVSLITRSTLILRDRELLAEMAREGLVEVAFSIATLDAELERRMEPRAATAARRLAAMAELAAAGVPVSVLVAPVIPGLSDAELENILERAATAGAIGAGFILLRLPHELRELFPAWLREHYPGRAKRVLSLLRQLHGGQLYNAEYGQRMRGSGPLADLLTRRFERACHQLGLDRPLPSLRCDLFRPPPRGGQLSLL